ncbi:hypothetical protein ACVWZM_002956 [Bradyrhizobium sp. USDA 4501]
MPGKAPQVEPLPPIEPQYLQAATIQAGQLNTLVWQKMGLIFAVQSATIFAAYFLRGSFLSWMTLLVGLLFCSGVVMSIHLDVKGRGRLLAQANYIGRHLLRLSRRDIVFSLEPYPDWTHRPHWTFWRLGLLTGIYLFAAFAFNVPCFREQADVYLPAPLLPSTH